MGGTLLLFHRRRRHENRRNYYATGWTLLPVLFQSCLRSRMVYGHLIYRSTGRHRSGDPILRSYQTRAACENSSNESEDLGIQRSTAPQFLPRGLCICSIVRRLVWLIVLPQIIFTILVSARIFKGTKYVTLRDFQIGIPACLLAVEQVAASTLFIWAFPVRPYKELKHESKMNPAFALLNACNIMDVIYGSIYAVQLLAKGVGPYGNGSWNKTKNGYNKIRDPITNVQMKRARTFRPSSTQGEDVVLAKAAAYEPMRVEQPGFTDVSPPPSYRGSNFTGHSSYEDSSYGGIGGLEDDRDELLAASRTSGS